VSIQFLVDLKRFLQEIENKKVVYINRKMREWIKTARKYVEDKVKEFWESG